MAKKHNRQSKLKTYSDRTVDYLYRHGFLHSLVWHISLLLLLALWYPILLKPNQKLSPISLSFQTISENADVETESFPEIENTIEISETTSSTASSTCPDDNLVSEAQNDQDVLMASLELLDFETPEENDSIEDINLVQEIKSLETVEQETDATPTKAKSQTKSDKKQKRSPLPGLPETFLQEGNQANTQMTTHISDQTHQGEIGRRLAAAGAQTGDIQISLAWDTTDDLDLHVVVNPLNSHISWMNRTGPCGGMLDVDMNFHPGILTDKPVENIFWAHGSAPHAEYTIGVHYYATWSRTPNVKATVLIKVDGKTQSFPVVVRFGQPLTPVTRFTR